jgi:hypothetical protein
MWFHSEDGTRFGNQSWARAGQTKVRHFDDLNERIAKISFQDAPKASTECLIKIEGQFSTSLSELESFLPARRFKKRTPQKTQQKKSSISLFIFPHMCVYGD